MLSRLEPPRVPQYFKTWDPLGISSVGPRSTITYKYKIIDTLAQFVVAFSPSCAGLLHLHPRIAKPHVNPQGHPEGDGLFHLVSQHFLDLGDFAFGTFEHQFVMHL
jgi:hypothetical protein